MLPIFSLNNFINSLEPRSTEGKGNSELEQLESILNEAITNCLVSESEKAQVMQNAGKYKSSELTQFIESIKHHVSELEKEKQSA